MQEVSIFRDKTTAVMMVGVLAVLGIAASMLFPAPHRGVIVGTGLATLGGSFLRAVYLGWVYGEIYSRFSFVSRRDEPLSYWFYLCIWAFGGLAMLLLGLLIVVSWALNT